MSGQQQQAPAKQPSNWNVPNVLTSLRIIVIPVFAWLVLKGNNHHVGWMWWSFGTFVALMITDKLDGDIARARGLITNFGKIADPIADKALMTTALPELCGCIAVVGNNRDLYSRIRHHAVAHGAVTSWPGCTGVERRKNQNDAAGCRCGVLPGAASRLDECAQVCGHGCRSVGDGSDGRAVSP